jgi:hypothetical protein
MAIQVVQRSPATVFLRGRKLFLELELDQVSGFEDIFKEDSQCHRRSVREPR